MKHTHMNPTHLFVGVAATVAFYGTLHMYTLVADNRFAKALTALGF